MSNILKFLLDILKWLAGAVRFILPWILRFLGVMLTLMASSIIGVFQGQFNRSKELCETWIERMTASHIPDSYLLLTKYCLWVIAFFMNLTGFVILCFAVVTLIRWITGL